MSTPSARIAGDVGHVVLVCFLCLPPLLTLRDRSGRPRQQSRSWALDHPHPKQNSPSSQVHSLQRWPTLPQLKQQLCNEPAGVAASCPSKRVSSRTKQPSNQEGVWVPDASSTPVSVFVAFHEILCFLLPPQRPMKSLSLGQVRRSGGWLEGLAKGLLGDSLSFPLTSRSRQ